MMKEKDRQQTLDINGIVAPRRRQKDRLLRHRLKEVLHGKRPALKVYSRRLQADLWFVNEGLADPADATFGGRVITMAGLANMMKGGTPLSQAIQALLEESEQQ